MEGGLKFEKPAMEKMAENTFEGMMRNATATNPNVQPEALVSDCIKRTIETFKTQDGINEAESAKLKGHLETYAKEQDLSHKKAA